MVLVERLVPNQLWELFQLVVPAAPTRSQGGGLRHGNREVPAAIVFVATSGCTWAQLPACFGPSDPTAHRRLTGWSKARVGAKLRRILRDELDGPGRRKSGRLHGDKAYDHRFVRSYLRRRQITARIARRGVEPSTRLGRHR